MSNILTSIIVPVYNAERYLKECINSVFNLDDPRWQLILINDGSKDESANICKEYSVSDERVIYLEQKNAGVSAARNKGIQYAKGEWVTFLDADDMLTPNALKLLEYATISDDMIVAGYTKNIEGYTSSMECQHISAFELQRSILNLCQFKSDHTDITAIDDYNRWSCWGRFYRNKILQENKIEFPVGIKLGEDLLFCLRYAQRIQRVLTNSSTIYYYRVNEGSVTQRFRDDRIENTARLIAGTAECIQNKLLDSHLNVFVIDRITKCCLDYFTDVRCGLTQKEAVSKLRTLCESSVFQRAINNTGYSNLAIGKKNKFFNGVTLWFLKRHQYYALIVCLKMLKKVR